MTGISLNRRSTPLTATGGHLRTIHPWQPDDLDPTPLTYRYAVPAED
ncbi:hypothetical protein V5P93_006111 [Actinokineospora auranticolor]|uniref:Uncharacterized protein n=1 Tax=Actinokineospora auranticolor TaxID=155976 RepID=A0A2S6GG71_9PSEU|nr:hypothetical protein [Actinokineospora auranticolor]PPK64200.1 hypothetical protein CLV40_12164 [Actinokineospora auranticolor]